MKPSCLVFTSATLLPNKNSKLRLRSHNPNAKQGESSHSRRLLTISEGSVSTSKFTLHYPIYVIPARSSLKPARVTRSASELDGEYCHVSPTARLLLSERDALVSLRRLGSMSFNQRRSGSVGLPTLMRFGLFQSNICAYYSPASDLPISLPCPFLHHIQYSQDHCELGKIT